jgi:hypothetical protein
MSLPGLLSPVGGHAEEQFAGHAEPPLHVQVPPRQVLTGLQLVVLPLADFNWTFNFDGLMPAALVAIALTTCETVIEHELVPDEQVLPRVDA